MGLSVSNLLQMTGVRGPRRVLCNCTLSSDQLTVGDTEVGPCTRNSMHSPGQEQGRGVTEAGNRNACECLSGQG